MKLTMNQMQQQALYAAQHKKCKYTVNVQIYFGACTPLTISICQWEGSEIKKYKLYIIHDDKNYVDEFNEAIKVINGEIDPFEEENTNE